MKKTAAHVLLVVSFICGIAVYSLNAEDGDTLKPREAAAPKKWVHLAMARDATKPLSDPEFAKKINKLGTDGWELVTVENFVEEGTTTKTHFYFKRPLQ